MKTIDLKAETTVSYFFTCPNCDSEYRHDITRAVNDPVNLNRRLGPETCRDCQHKIYFTLRPEYDAAGAHLRVDTEVEPIAPENQYTEGLVLLESNCKDENGRIYLIVYNSFLNKIKNPEEDGTLMYHYDEGTCPTNWTKDIIAFVHQSDDDPHGVFTYVKHLTREEIEAKFKEHNLKMLDLDWWMFKNNNFSQMLFPEIFTNPQPPKSWDPQYNKS